jgi:excisionase family DNA binding protein
MTKTSIPNTLRCFSDPEAAELLGCSARNVYTLRKSGKLTYSKIGKRVFIKHTDLVALLNRHLGGIQDAA